jgi:hypothetical protein
MSVPPLCPFLDYLDLRLPSEREGRSDEGEDREGGGEADGGGLLDRGDSTARGADGGGE